MDVLLNSSWPTSSLQLWLYLFAIIIIASIHYQHYFVLLCLQVVIRMQQYKDDLLASCLRLVLSLPLEIVELDVASLVPAIKVRYVSMHPKHLSQALLFTIPYIKHTGAVSAAIINKISNTTNGYFSICVQYILHTQDTCTCNSPIFIGNFSNEIS